LFVFFSSISFTSLRLRVHGTELYGRSAIRAAKRISNPGCYATSSQMLIAPLVNFVKQDAWPTVFGMSGYSGAGTVPSHDADGRPVSLPKVTPESLGGSVRPYSLTNHIHEREAAYHLSMLSSSPIKIAFIPSVAPWFSGIISTLSLPLNEQLSAKDVIGMYEKMYQGEKLVRIKKDVPSLQDIENKHHWIVGGVQVHSEGDRVVVVVRVFFSFYFVLSKLTVIIGWTRQPIKRCCDPVSPKSQPCSWVRRVCWYPDCVDEKDERAYLYAYNKDEFFVNQVDACICSFVF